MGKSVFSFARRQNRQVYIIHNITFFSQFPGNNDKADLAVFSLRYVMTKGTATVTMGGPHLTVTSQGEVAA